MSAELGAVDREAMARLVTAKARELGIPPALALGLVKQESGFNPRAYRPEPGYYDRNIATNPARWGRSPVFRDRQLWGSHGLTQVLTSTAIGQGYPLTLDPRKGGTAEGRAWPSLYDPAFNAELGLRYFLGRLARYRNFRDALAAYNAGNPQREAGQRYARTVLSHVARYLRAGVV